MLGVRPNIPVRFLMRIVFPLVALVSTVCAQSSTAPRADSFDEIRSLVDGVRATSYPRLKAASISIQRLRNDHVFLESRFTFRSFFLGRKLRYKIFFNAEAIARQVPADGLRAIIAHELAHIDFYQRNSRWKLLGLVRLLSPNYAARFERTTDLEAIAAGYGPGLESFRIWLYRNIPSRYLEQKRRDYFSPEEIEAILRAEREEPGVMQRLSTCVPRNLAEIEREIRNPSSRCDH
jgi:hypothetical protein